MSQPFSAGSTLADAPHFSGGEASGGIFGGADPSPFPSSGSVSGGEGDAGWQDEFGGDSSWVLKQSRWVDIQRTVVLMVGSVLLLTALATGLTLASHHSRPKHTHSTASSAHNSEKGSKSGSAPYSSASTSPSSSVPDNGGTSPASTPANDNSSPTASSSPSSSTGDTTPQNSTSTPGAGSTSTPAAGSPSTPGGSGTSTPGNSGGTPSGNNPGSGSTPSSSTPQPAQTPEATSAVLLPLAGAVIVGGVVAVRWRRRARHPSL